MYVGERQGDGDRQRNQLVENSEDCYIDLFLTHIVIPYSGPYVFASLLIGTHLGSIVGYLPPWAPANHSQAVTLVTLWLCDSKNWLYLTWAPVYI